MRKRPANFAHVSLFADRVAPVIETLLADAIILGLFIVTFDFVRILQASDSPFVGEPSFYKRIFLLVWVLAFTAYNALCYGIYLQGFKDNEANRKAGRFQPYAGTETPRADSRRVVLLFIIDLAQVGIAALLFVGLVPSERDQQGAKRGAVSVAEVENRLQPEDADHSRPAARRDSAADRLAALLAIPARRWGIFFGLLALWHVLVYCWYMVWAWNLRYAGSRRGFFWSLSHGAFAMTYLACALGAWIASRFEHEAVGNVIDAVGMAVLSVTIGILYAVQLRHTFDDIHGEGGDADMLPEDISATAFLVNESRGRRLDIGQDRYAKDWIPPTQVSRVLQLWDEFAREVYPHDDIEIALRNRFFLDHLNAAAQDRRRHLVSLGAGFTSYPFLLQRDQWQSFIEVDLPNIISAKKNRMRELIDQQVLPPVDVEFMEADLRDVEQIDQLMEKIHDRLRAGGLGSMSHDTEPTVILLEGVSYYLTDASLNRLFQWFEKVQSTGSLFALDYWPANAVDAPAFKRQQAYFASKFGFESVDYSFIEHGTLENLPGYEVVELSNVQELEARYCRSTVLAEDNIIPEYVAVLRRTA